MNPTTFSRSAAALALAGVLLSPLLASHNEQQPATDAAAPIRLNVNLVQVPATVTDSRGRTISSLTQDAFRLFVDGELQPITAFHGEDAPVTAGLVVDNSASMAAKQTTVIAAALGFARLSNSRDEMFVVHFSNRVHLGLPPDKPFTGDVSELESAISRFELGGTTALYDALMFAQTRFQRAAYTRRILLVITDGADNCSHANLSEVLNSAQKSGIVLYTVGLFEKTERTRDMPALIQMAEDTGGKAFFPQTLSETNRICEEIAREIRKQYTLGFSGGEDGKYHRIEVSVQDSRYGALKVNTRPGYFASKP